jgi:hypothetical protein
MKTLLQLAKLIIRFPRASLMATISLFIAMKISSFLPWFDAPFKLATVIVAFAIGAAFDFRYASRS